MSLESWRPVVGFEGLYEVSDTGRIRNNRGYVLSSYRNNSGYRAVKLYNRGSVRSFLVHRLVCMAFSGEPGARNAVARHKNGDLLDNSADNLLWGTHSDNAFDQVNHGTHTNASKAVCKRGHDLNSAYITKRGSRQCRKCLQLHDKKRRST